MSPDVDVEIGGKHTQTSDETESEMKQPIDDRLRWIQMEDNLPGVSKRDEINDNESDEIVKEKTDKNHPELKPIEYKRVLNHFEKLNFKNGFCQELSSADDCFIPDFCKQDKEFLY